MIKLFIQGRKGEIEVAGGSLTLNDVIDNISQIKLKFRNSGDTSWVEERFDVMVGASYFKFGGGMTAHVATIRRSPGMDYLLSGEIIEPSGNERHSIVIAASVQDENQKWERNTFELVYISEQKPEAVLSNVIPGSDKLKHPHIMKRNARYRGQRESEKVLSDHHEQILDIRVNYVDIQNLTSLQDDSVNSWFNGENEAPMENITFSAEKTFDYSNGRSTYSFAPYIKTTAFQSLMVQLDGITKVNGTHYIHTDGTIEMLGAHVGAKLKISYTATMPIQQQRMVGLYEIRENIERLSERTNDLSERMIRHENARQ